MTACSQSPATRRHSWQLLPPGTVIGIADTALVLPLADGRLALAYRRTQDVRVRIAAIHLAGADREADELRRAIAAMRIAADAGGEAATRCQGALERSCADLAAANARIARMRPWATVGRISACLGGLALTVGAVRALSGP